MSQPAVDRIRSILVSNSKILAAQTKEKTPTKSPTSKAIVAEEENGKNNLKEVSPSTRYFFNL